MLGTPVQEVAPTTEAYLQHIPYFISFVALGILVNLLRKFVKKEKPTKLRILEEVAASFWIALIGAGLLDYYTDMGDFLIYGISSMLGYFHSFIIDKVGEGLIEYAVKKAKKKIDSYFDKDTDKCDQDEEEPNEEP